MEEVYYAIFKHEDGNEYTLMDCGLSLEQAKELCNALCEMDGDQIYYYFACSDEKFFD